MENIHGGFVVFLNHVSKRIHPGALKEAFSEYGRVSDVYIAYNNVRRRDSQRTVAFIRFSKRSEALEAMERTNDRSMDGFKIKVFRDRNFWGKSRGARNVAVKESAVQKQAHEVRVNGVDGRSYKEVLLSNVVPPMEAEGVVGSLLVDDRKLRSKDLSPDVVERVLLEIKEKDKEGFKVKVRGWSSFYVIISFEEEEQIDIFWDMKELFIKPWLIDMETVDNFMKMRKLSVWVSVEGLSLEAWNDSVLTKISNRLGNVIRLDKDTAERNFLGSLSAFFRFKRPEKNA
ncbi:hypothetical protein V6N13_104339 [Hibiscus sabdariffa]|uniref:Uncharacterized protein n=2 Tax=Hibiscus sabdariffa TaxID=183260 RepID=A0ABR1ZR08_9ROSI